MQAAAIIKEMQVLPEIDPAQEIKRRELNLLSTALKAPALNI